jgi:Zn-dependent protease with chaperone function
VPPLFTGDDENLLAGLRGRLTPPSLPFAYSIGLGVVSVAMVLLPLLYMAIVAASAAGVLWWAVHGLGLLMHGSMGSLKIRLFLYLAPLVGGGALPIFLVKPLCARTATPSSDLTIERRDQPLLIAFVERLAAVVGAPVPHRVVIDCNVNAGAGLELGLLRREGSSLVLAIGLPLVAGLTLPQLASVLAHEFGHFSQGAGMRLGRLIRGVNAWFDRVVHERDGWDTALERGTREGGWQGLAYLGAQLVVALGRKLLFGLMVVGHAVSCFLSRQMEFDADQYGARVAGSSTFADTSLRVRVLGAAAEFVTSSALGKSRFVDDLPGLVVRVADQAPSRLIADIRMDVQRSGTGLFDTHPSDLERLRRIRAGRFPGLLSNKAPASVLFRDFPAVCRRATLAFYERALGDHAPAPDALLPVEAFIAPAAPPGGETKPAKLEFPPERPPRLASHVRRARGDAGAFRDARERWRAAARMAVTAVERFRLGYAQWLDAAQAEALLAAGLKVRPQDFSLPAATPEGVERTRARALAIQAEAVPGLEGAERALGERVGLAVGMLGDGMSALPDAATLCGEAQRLLAALPALEKIQAHAAELRPQAVVLDCLLINQKSRLGHAGLDQEIGRRLPEARRAIDAVRASLETIALPGPEWDIPPPWRDDPDSHVRSARRALEVLDAQHARAVARLVLIADRVESALAPASD